MKNKSSSFIFGRDCCVKRGIALCTVLAGSCGLLCTALWRVYRVEPYFSFAVTFWTTFYHFAMRLLVGFLVMRMRKGRTKEDRKPYSLRAAERRFCEKIRIKKWKRFAPTYKKELFCVERSDLEPLMHAMVDAQIGHSIMAALSLAPILLSVVFGGFAAFLSTSLFFCCFDLGLVILQKYNRARLSRLLQKELLQKKRVKVKKNGTFLSCGRLT